jgi:serine/threonine-protein kinase
MTLRAPLLTSLKRFKKQKERAKVIAVLGVSRGVGVTHFSIQLAHYYARQRLKVGLIELNDHHHFEKILEAYEGRHYQKSNDTTFRLKGVDYHHNCPIDHLLNIYQSAYDYIILDIGDNVKPLEGEILRADRTFVVAKVSDWKREEIRSFTTDYNLLMTPRCEWLFPFGKDSDIKEIKGKLQRVGHSLPFVEDPYVKHKGMVHTLNRLTKEEV